MSNRLGTNDPIYDLSRIGGGMNPLPGSTPNVNLDATAVGYGDDSNNLTGDVANFYYNDTTKLLSVKINEAWVQETKYLVVDAGGRGDFTTFQAAINYMDANSTTGDQWTVLVRNGVYEERPIFNTDASRAYAVTFVGLGTVIIQSEANAFSFTLSSYANPVEFRNITFKHIGIATAWDYFWLGNGNTSIFRDCTISILSQFVAAGNFDATFYHCNFIAPGRFVFEGSLNATFWDCEFNSSPTLGYSVVYATGGNNILLHHCRVINGGAGWDLEQNGGTMTVGRCLYNTANTYGTIATLDGDVPAPDSGSITPAMLANASAQYKYLISGATPFAYAESGGFLNITAAKTLAVTGTLTLTPSSDGLTATIPATGTVAMLSAANVFTEVQKIGTPTTTVKALAIKALSGSFPSTDIIFSVQNTSNGVAFQVLNNNAVNFGTFVPVGSTTTYGANYVIFNGRYAISNDSNTLKIGDNSAWTKITFFVDKAAILPTTGYFGFGTLTPTALIHVFTAGDVYGVQTIAKLEQSRSSGGSDGDGGSILMAGKSSTTAAQSMARLYWQWGASGGATHASRFADLVATVYDAGGEREGWRIKTNGSIAKTHFINSINLAAVTPTVVAGDLYNDTGQAKHGSFTNGLAGWFERCIWSGYAEVTHTGVVTSQSMFTATAKGTRTLPANFWKQGKAIRVRLQGHYTTDAAAGNATIDVVFGAVTFRTTGSFALDNSVTDGFWALEFAIVCETTGATGTVNGTVTWLYSKTTGGTTPIHGQQATTHTPVTVDTTAAALFDVLWTADDAGTVLHVDTALVWEVC